MMFAIFFAFWRFMEIITLIPCMGMLAYFVNGYTNANMLTPSYILILFIVSVLALAWAMFTLFSYHRSSSNARFVGLVDLGFVGAFIAAVYYLRFIGGADCTHITAGSSYDVSFGIFGSGSVNGVSVSTDKTCAMLKACWAFGIMNCIFFFITAVLAWIHGDSAAVSEKRYYQETYRSGSRRRSGSHHGSHHGSRRSSHSHHRTYV
ncbi:hypothetical protein QBC46DRAFT_83291 [Diplogelasinospora grovesii]|uniref:MARVEL domain-containing protein n=1 Tax=Diplogelasinospora grovesii TaxID=303347 RepID=A0AAN6MXH2_9PEZI|nr:hypothetical protein QBC46DRAFT_83291 [Diplogelasinospora grovesii]